MISAHLMKGFFRPAGIPEQSPSNGDEVDFPFLNHTIRVLRVFNIPHANDGDIDRILDARGKRDEKALACKLISSIADESTRNVNAINPRLGETNCRTPAIFLRQTARHEIVGPQSIEKRETLSHSLSNGADDFTDK